MKSKTVHFVTKPRQLRVSTLTHISIHQNILVLRSFLDEQITISIETSRRLVTSKVSTKSRGRKEESGAREVEVSCNSAEVEDQENSGSWVLTWQLRDSGSKFGDSFSRGVIRDHARPEQ